MIHAGLLSLIKLMPLMCFKYCRKDKSREEIQEACCTGDEGLSIAVSVRKKGVPRGREICGTWVHE